MVPKQEELESFARTVVLSDAIENANKQEGKPYGSYIANVLRKGFAAMAQEAGVSEWELLHDASVRLLAETKAEEVK